MRLVCVGLSTVDLVHRVPRIPGPDEKAQATSVEVAAGGPALNAAVTAAVLGADVTLVTAIGSHPLGGLIRQDLEGYGVKLLDAAEDATEPPPLSAVTVEEGTGRRSIVSRNAGAVTPRMPSCDLSGVVLVDGHHPALARAAAERAGTLVVDAGHWRPVFAEVLPHADVVAASAGFHLPTGDPLPEIAPHVAITNGPAPVRWWSSARSGAATGSTSGAATGSTSGAATGPASGERPVPAVEAVDTAGAGDAFHGALAFAIAAGASFVEALDEAIRVAAIRVQHAGPRAWLADPALRRSP